MVLIRDLTIQGAQMLLVLLLAPLFTGFVRKVKARLLRRRGPPLTQPYFDLVRLMRKDVVLADSASWLFRVVPYLVFASTWVAASLIPTFRTGLLFSWSADLIAVAALIGNGRFFLALAGLDVGTSFGGIGSSREVMIASLAEPAMIMIVFTLALIAGSTQLSTMAAFMASSAVGLRVSLALALVALIMVAIAENGRIPIDNPATHLELTMVHEAMVLEYSGRHLALIELASWLKAASVAWQAFIQDAPHLYITAMIALTFKAIVIPVALHRIIVRLGIHREIEKVVGVGSTMLAGIALVALAMVVMLRVTQEAGPLAREDLAFALSVVLLGLLMMVTRRNAVSQVVGFMSLENGLVLAATGAKGMPLVVEISVAFSVLIAFIVIGIFLFRIRERFDTVDVHILSDFRGERQ